MKRFRYQMKPHWEYEKVLRAIGKSFEEEAVSHLLGGLQVSEDFKEFMEVQTQPDGTVVAELFAISKSDFEELLFLSGQLPLGELRGKIQKILRKP